VIEIVVHGLKRGSAPDWEQKRTGRIMPTVRSRPSAPRFGHHEPQIGAQRLQNPVHGTEWRVVCQVGFERNYHRYLEGRLHDYRCRAVCYAARRKRYLIT
jgi:hypothetical protein